MLPNDPPLPTNDNIPSSTASGLAPSEQVDEIAVEGIAVDEIAADPLLEPIADPAAVEAARVFTIDEFREFHASLYPTAGYLLGAVYPPPWQSLIHAPTGPEFAPASDALYRMALKYPWLRFLIDPASEWIKDFSIIVAFGGKVGFGVYVEMQSRGMIPPPAPRVAPQPASKPAETNA